MNKSHTIKSRVSGLLIMLICLAMISGCLTGSRETTSSSRAARKGLAIVNFRNLTPSQKAAEYRPWRHGIPAMMMTDLESLGLFNLVSREKLKDILSEQALQESGLVDPTTVVRVGKLVAAHFILTGSYCVIGDDLRLETQVYAVESGVLLGAAAVTGATNTFFELEKQLVIKISSYLETMLTRKEELQIAGNIETRSVQASLNNYAGELAIAEATELKGQGLSREARAAENQAADKFKEALKIDPNYKRARKNLKKLMSGIPLTL